LQISDAVPASLRAQAQGWNIPANTFISFHVATSEIPANVTKIPWVYALVAPFPTVTDNVSADEVKNVWTRGDIPSAFNGQPLLMDESTRAAFTTLWGEPAADALRILPAEDLLDTAWSELPSWAIVPFEELDTKWKVLTIDGQSPIRKNFDLSRYPLVVTFAFETSPDLQPSSFNLPPSNYDASKLTTIIMTGITALVRATAYTMEMKGVLYPGEMIRDTMLEADIAHVANHVPFSTGCRFPRPDQSALIFCSDPKYIDLFTDIGVDVVELTGHHFADYGAKATLETLEIYNSHNILYFGGGADKQDALKPALFEHNGNKIAFIGCNRLDTGGPATATDERPGAAPCDFAYLQQEIAQLRSAGYVVIATNHWNQTYDYKPNPQQVIDFRLMVDWGASLVLGAQAHYAQTMEFYNDTFIHYGQGNLFFDQMGEQDWMPVGIRREFLDRYVVYDGKIISIELITTMLEDFSRPRLMTEQERAGFLQEYFYKSGWTPLYPTPTPTITPTLTPLSIPTLPAVSTATPAP
jgi:poly-gamma-glutamate synthesis protein (capsule biosynthesis protein)